MTVTLLYNHYSDNTYVKNIERERNEKLCNIAMISCQKSFARNGTSSKILDFGKARSTIIEIGWNEFPANVDILCARARAAIHPQTAIQRKRRGCFAFLHLKWASQVLHNRSPISRRAYAVNTFFHRAFLSPMGPAIFAAIWHTRHLNAKAR